MTKRVKVEAVGIQNMQTGTEEPGWDLEIYGHLGAWAIFTNPSGQPQARLQHLLMNNMDPDQRQSITQGSTLHIGRTTPEMEIRDNEELWVGGHLKEHDDTSPNDSLGDHHHKIPHSVLVQGTQRVHFQEDDQICEAIFEITVL